ncbi:hypothetical protein [Sorangium sp. So ce128]|uniref:hypothetical protein n=1 Tax=Sorangium sp. So ce128 TaxID=3133281 RepID=UPI003F63CA94
MKGIHTLVERWANAWSSGSPDELLSLLSDDCIYEDVPTQHVTRGKQRARGAEVGPENALR